MDETAFRCRRLNHNHIYGQVDCRFGPAPASPVSREGRMRWPRNFPRLRRRPAHRDGRGNLEDESIGLIVSGRRFERARETAIRAMQHGKDVLVDKPGMTSSTARQAAPVQPRRAASSRSSIRSISMSPATVKAGELVAAGAIGEVCAHSRPRPAQLRRGTRPDWFCPPHGLWRHPDRHRIAPVRAVPVLHRRQRTRPCFRRASATGSVPDAPELQDTAASTSRPGGAPA